MCGIIAIAGKNLKRDSYDTKAMVKTLVNRGPDAEGSLDLSTCWLAHKRLSIIDPTQGQQPMVDEQLSITFNGEIYNYLELRKELENKNHRFQTNSDTEVILKAYKEYGTDCPKHLDGMFAFVIWDNRNQQLFMARDRFGKKPLYYSFDGDNILIASEIKALLASGKIKKDLNYEALDNYLYLMYVPPWKSIYQNILQLPPSHSAVFKNGKFVKNKYWNLNLNPLSIEYNEAKEEVRRLLTLAVKKRMLASHVEVGSFLSGGVDSTIITFLAKEHVDHPIKTFSLGYGDYINELPFAQQAATKIGSDHHTLQVSSDQVSELEKIVNYFDEPHADNSDFPQHLLSSIASSKVKVALSGDGGDEIFMGYGWHTRHRNLSYRTHPIDKLFLNSFQGRIKSQRIFSPLARTLLWGSPLKVNNNIFAPNAFASSMSPSEKITTFDFTTYLPGQLLAKVDRTSMMHGLEVRSPFLDTALVEFVVNLPEEFKINGGVQKYILKDLLSEYMPKEFVYRRKQGFGAPTIKWLRDPNMSSYVISTLGKTALVRNLFTGTSIDFMINRFYKKHNNSDAMRLWILLCLEIWLKKAKPNI